MPDLPHAPHVPPHAYLITLQPLDSAPIQTMRARLAAHGFTVVLVEGVRGADLSAREFFTLTNFWRARTGKLMTPGELGCTLSHQKALRMAAESGQGRHLILEDDFIASDAALAWIARVEAHVGTGVLLHMGGQENLDRFYRYLRGKQTEVLSEIYELNPSDLKFLFTTVAYMVNAETAGSLSQLLGDRPCVADSFDYFLEHKALEKIWFRWVVSHDLEIPSVIQPERNSATATSKRHWSYRSRMNWARLWRHLVSPPSAFLKNQQPSNQLPV